MMRVYVDSPFRLVQGALCCALPHASSSELQVEAHCDLLSKCDLAVRDLQSYSQPFPGPFAIPTLALYRGGENNGAALLKLRYRGVLNETDSFETLVQALRAVARGEVWASRALLTRTFLNEGAPTLTEREREVLRRVSHGLSNRAIADELGISVRTVKSYVSSLLAKHETRNRVELILHYSDLSTSQLSKSQAP